jgi:uncharacterized protein YraI
LTGLALASSDASAQTAAYTSEPVDLYAGPSGDYPVVAQIGPGVPVTVMGCVSDYSWCDITVPGLRGWVYGGYLSYPYQGSYVPLTDYGATIGLPIVVFSLGAYWGSFYRDRPWYGDRDRWAHVPPPERGRPPGQPAWYGAPGRQPGMPPRSDERLPGPNAPVHGMPPRSDERLPGPNAPVRSGPPPVNAQAPRAPANMPPPNVPLNAQRPQEAARPPAPEAQQFGGRPPAGAPAQGYAHPPAAQPQGGMRAPGPAPAAAPTQVRPPAPPQGGQGGQGGHAPAQGGGRGDDRQHEH